MRHTIVDKNLHVDVVQYLLRFSESSRGVQYRGLKRQMDLIG